MENNNLKVLLISPLPPPVGGIASWTVNILNFFNENYRGFKLLHFNSAMSRNRITDRNWLRRIIYGINDVFVQLNTIRHIINKDKPDVIHLTSSASLALFKDYVMLWYLHKYKLKTVLHFHFGRIPDLKQKNNWEWKMLLRTVRKASTCIVLDTQSHKVLKAEGLNNIEILPNPIAFHKNDHDSKKESLNNRNEGVVLFVGHVVREKGVYELVEAVKNIDELKELIFVGPFEESVKNELLQIANSRQSLIKFLGVLSKEEVLQEMRKCSLFVLPSYSEGFPNVILEAMSCSCAIISTKVGAIPEMLGTESGICVNPKSVEELEINISKLILDKELRLTLGSNAYKFVMNNFNIEIIINQIQEIWFAKTNNNENTK